MTVADLIARLLEIPGHVMVTGGAYDDDLDRMEEINHVRYYREAGRVELD